MERNFPFPSMSSTACPVSGCSKVQRAHPLADELNVGPGMRIHGRVVREFSLGPSTCDTARPQDFLLGALSRGTALWHCAVVFLF